MGRGLWVIVYGAARVGVAALALPVLAGVALRERLVTRARRRRGDRPRLVWGPEPLISIKYWSAAMRERGYDSRTLVYTVYPANRREDFDVHRDEFLAGHGRVELVRDYAIFAWVLGNADVVMSFFDGGWLRATPLRRLEFALLHLAGKRLVVAPYGSDVAVVGHLGVAEAPLVEDYPWIPERSDAVRSRVDAFCRGADVVVRNYQFGYVPRWDVVWPSQLAIDTEAWSPSAGGGERSGEMVVVHAPNHRRIKGSDELIAAVERLRGEGVAVALDLLEGRPNEEVRQAIARADVVADQFVAGYAMFAIEGMAAGKPVLSALSWMDPEIRESRALRECPILDTGLGDIGPRLRELAGDPGLRERAGAAGRDFAERFHSYAAVGAGWEAILDHVWRGDELPAELPAA